MFFYHHHTMIPPNLQMAQERAADTSAGRDGAREIRDGLLPGLSVEFRATAQRYVDGERRISAALLNGAGLVDDPSYKGSRVEVRGKRGRRLWL